MLLAHLSGIPLLWGHRRPKKTPVMSDKMVFAQGWIFFFSLPSSTKWSPKSQILKKNVWFFNFSWLLRPSTHTPHPHTPSVLEFLGRKGSNQYMETIFWTQDEPQFFTIINYNISNRFASSPATQMQSLCIITPHFEQYTLMAQYSQTGVRLWATFLPFLIRTLWKLP